MKTNVLPLAQWWRVICILWGLTSRLYAGDPWRVVDQPDLKQALDNAPVLRTESLGEPARGVNVWERWMVPNPDSKSWDVLQIYFKEYYGPTWLFAIDLGTGQVKKQRLPDGHRKEYWLYHGEAILMTNSTPPWPGKASPWDKAVAKPEVYFDQIDPDLEGNAVLWHRSHEAPDREKSSGWKSIRLSGVPTYPHRINPLSVLPDGRLYGTGDDYVGTFIFDPKTDQTTYCGPRTGLAPYTSIICAGKLYLSGYSGGHLFVFDPAHNWTLGKGGPPGQARSRSGGRKK